MVLGEHPFALSVRASGKNVYRQQIARRSYHAATHRLAPPAPIHKPIMINPRILLGVAAIVFASLCTRAVAQQPNVLFILTDDQRYDSIQAFNRILHGRAHSELGYVESPNVDRLAEMGTTFIQTYCHAQGCAPSRASIHYGRYPHHTGLYEFEYHNNTLPHWELSLPESMKTLGYQTFHVGKLGVRARGLNAAGKSTQLKLYEQDISFHQMFREGLTDWTKGTVTEVNGIQLPEPTHTDWMVADDGSFEYTGAGLNNVPGLEDQSKTIDEKYALLRMYNHPKKRAYGSGEIIGGFSPQPGDTTRDGHYTSELKKFLQNPKQQLTIGSQTYTGVNPAKPLFAHIDYDFPHTPVLPTKEYFDRFQQYTYDIPQVDENEFDKLPPQLQRLVKHKDSDHYSEADKQQMVRDYFAFCAYGNELVGQAADAFIAYSEQQNQPWMVVYICGDHGWKLNEHSAISKFTPWKIDSHNPIIVVSSDKQAFPAGKVVSDLTEFVDIMPTCLAAGGADLSQSKFDFLDGYDLAKVTSGDLPPRPYVLSESHAVTGARATIRTKDYMLSIKPRPNAKHGADMAWAMAASLKELEPVLYDLKADPDELNNLAFNPEHHETVEVLKTKLLNIVLGDDRVEVNWNKWGDGTEFFTNNFAPRADDKKLP